MFTDLKLCQALNVTRGTAAWIEYAATISESISAALRHFITGFRNSGLSMECLISETNRLRVLYYRIVYECYEDDDLTELIACLGLLPPGRRAYARAQQIQECLFRNL